MIAARNIFYLFSSIILFCVAISSVHAIEYGGVGGQPAFPRADEPKSRSIFVHTLNPGELQNEAVVVINSSSTERTILVNGVGSVNSSGGGVACAQTLDLKSGVGLWITLEKNELTLAADANEQIPFVITVPAGTAPGEYNGCIVIEEKPGEQKEGLTLTTRVGLRVKITVPGEFERAVTNPTVVMKGNEDGDAYFFRVSAKNGGTVSIDTDVALTMRSLVLGLVHERRGGEYPIYPGRHAEWNFDVKKPFWGGPYLATASFSYDSDGDGAYDTTKRASPIFLFVVPEPIALGIEVAVLIGLCVWWHTMRKRKKMRRRQEKIKRLRRSKMAAQDGRQQARAHPESVRRKHAAHRSGTSNFSGDDTMRRPHAVRGKSGKRNSNNVRRRSADKSEREE